MGDLSQIRGGLVFWVLILRILIGCYECFRVICCCLLPKLDEAYYFETLITTYLAAESYSAEVYNLNFSLYLKLNVKSARCLM